MDLAIVYLSVLILIGLGITAHAYRNEGGLREAFLPVERKEKK